jgi:hypothetical protein
MIKIGHHSSRRSVNEGIRRHPGVRALLVKESVPVPRRQSKVV